MINTDFIVLISLFSLRSTVGGELSSFFVLWFNSLMICGCWIPIYCWFPFSFFLFIQDSILDLTIGPYETYEDALFGYKVQLKFNLHIYLYVTLLKRYSRKVKNVNYEMCSRDSIIVLKGNNTIDTLTISSSLSGSGKISLY